MATFATWGHSNSNAMTVIKKTIIIMIIITTITVTIISICTLHLISLFLASRLCYILLLVLSSNAITNTLSASIRMVLLVLLSWLKPLRYPAREVERPWASTNAPMDSSRLQDFMLLLRLMLEILHDFIYSTFLGRPCDESPTSLALYQGPCFVDTPI